MVVRYKFSTGNITLINNDDHANEALADAFKVGARFLTFDLEDEDKGFSRAVETVTQKTPERKPDPSPPIKVPEPERKQETTTPVKQPEPQRTTTPQKQPEPERKPETTTPQKTQTDAPKFCPECGSKIGNPVPKFCADCGYKLGGTPSATTSTSSNSNSSNLSQSLPVSNQSQSSTNSSSLSKSIPESETHYSKEPPKGGCAACGKELGFGSHVRALETTFHRDCFKCDSCAKSLLEISFIPDEKNKPLCPDCFELKVLKKCYSCKKPIKSTYLDIEGNFFHKECFTCHNCGSQFEGGYFIEKGKHLCNKCVK